MLKLALSYMGLCDGKLTNCLIDCCDAVRKNTGNELPAFGLRMQRLVHSAYQYDSSLQELGQSKLLWLLFI